jgi:hypothetical protein
MVKMNYPMARRIATPHLLKNSHMTFSSADKIFLVACVIRVKSVINAGQNHDLQASFLVRLSITICVSNDLICIQVDV